MHPRVSNTTAELTPCLRQSLQLRILLASDAFEEQSLNLRDRVEKLERGLMNAQEASEVTGIDQSAACEQVAIANTIRARRVRIRAQANKTVASGNAASPHRAMCSWVIPIAVRCAKVPRPSKQLAELPPEVAWVDSGDFLNIEEDSSSSSSSSESDSTEGEDSDCESSSGVESDVVPSARLSHAAFPFMLPFRG